MTGEIYSADVHCQPASGTIGDAFTRIESGRFAFNERGINTGCRNIGSRTRRLGSRPNLDYDGRRSQRSVSNRSKEPSMCKGDARVTSFVT